MDMSVKHQYGFSFMRQDTGGQKVHSFWGYGDSEESCKQNAIEKARQFKESYEREINDKIRAKSERRGERYAPSHVGVQIVGCSLWR